MRQLLKPTLIIGLVFAVFCASLLTASAQIPLSVELVTQELILPDKKYIIKVPKGYVFELLTDKLDGPRMLSFDKYGVLFIGSKSDQIYRLEKPYRHHTVFAEIDNYPHSISFRENSMFVAVTNGLLVTEYSPGDKLKKPADFKKIMALPGGRGHRSRTVRVGPDQRIYISIGINGNCSDQSLSYTDRPFDRRGGILVLNEKKRPMQWETYASGLRNPVGFDWHPATGVMYLTNNGPDHLGFEQPPEYFSRVEADSFHGMPWFYYDGIKIKRDNCIASSSPEPINQVVTPVQTFPSRNAPLGMSFIKKGAMEPALENNAIVALHGSWATKPSGGFFGKRSTRREPKLVIVRFNKGQAIRVDDLVSGFQLQDGTRLLRPAGVEIGPDGHVYFTSDGGVNGLFRLRRLH